MAIQVAIQPVRTADRVHEHLGIKSEIIIDAIRGGESLRNIATTNDPVIFAGFLGFVGTVRTLRELTLPLGWRKNDDRNYSTVISPDGKNAIAVATGDDNTGNPSFSPRTKHPKGPATVDRVDRNQGVLFTWMEEEAEEREVEEKRTTWILLRRKSLDRVFFELSLPDGITRDGVITSWNQRIIFEPLESVSESFGDHGIFEHEIEDAFTEDISIEIVRKDSAEGEK